MATKNRFYGAEYEQLLLRAYENTKGKKTWNLPIDNPNSMRTRVYYYFSKLREENLRTDLIDYANTLSVRVARIGTTSCLQFFRKTEGLDALAIRRALQLPEDFATAGTSGVLLTNAAATADSKKKLREIRSKKKTV